MGDLDGDGAVDLIYLVRSGTERRAVVRWGATSAGVFVFGFPVEIPIGLGAAASLSIADYDADGVGDVLVTMGTSYGLLRSNGAARTFALRTLPYGALGGVVWGDFNGDGRVDYAACYNGVWHLWANDPSIAVPTPASLRLPCPSGAPPALAVDVDGDGASELVAGLVRPGRPVEMGIGGLNYALRWLPLPIIEPIEGYRWVPQGATLTELNGTTHIARSRVGDFNGDGLPDYLFPEHLSADQVPVGASVFLWTGAGVIDMLSAFSITSAPPRAYEMADFNADARTDHAFAWDDRIHIELTGNMESRQTGDWKLGEFDVALPPGPDVSGLDAIDLDGDGNLDLVVTREDRVDVLAGGGDWPDLLTNVHETRSVYPAVAIDYTTLASATHYDASGCVSTYPIQFARPAGMVVVGRMDVGSSNQTPPRTETYLYARGRRDLSGRGFLGFETITATDPVTHQTREDDYGVPDAHGPTRYFVASSGARHVTFRSPLDDGTVMVDESNESVDVQAVTADDRSYYQVRGQGSTSRQYIEGSTKPRSERSTTIDRRDARGFPTLVRTEWLGGDYRETTTEYHHDATAHIYGLPRRQSIVDHVRVDGLWQVAEQTYEWRYDAHGRIDRSTRRAAGDPMQLTTTYTYDEYGNTRNVRSETAHDGTRSSTVSHLDADRMYPTLILNPMGHATTYDYHPVFGIVRQSIDANGEVTGYAYDGFGLLRLLAPPSGPMTQYYRQPATGEDVHHRDVTAAPGRPAVTVDVDHLGRVGAATSYGFDGRMIHRTTSYDARGRPDSTSGWYYRGDAPRDFVHTTYDVLDRVVSRESADGQRVDVRYEVSDLPDESGESVVSTDVLGNETRMTFDARGRLVGLTDAKQGTLVHRYGPFGWPVKTRDPTGAITTVDWDAYGVRRSIDDPSQGRLSFDYSAFGDVTSWVDGTGTAFTMTHDALGRPRTRSAIGSTRQDAWYYDEPLTDACTRSTRVPGKNPHSIGRLTCAISADAHSTEHAYDAAGRTASVRYRVGTRDMRYDFGYDPEGRLDVLMYPQSLPDRRLAVRYRYQNGMVSRAEVASTGHVLWQREVAEAGGATLESSAGNGVRTHRTFRPMGAVSTEQHVDPLGRPLFDFAYDYDRAGNLTAQRDMRQVMSERYEYDELQRLARSCIDNSVEPAKDDDEVPNTPSWPLPAEISWPFDKAEPFAKTADQLARWRDFARSPHVGAASVAVARALGVPVPADGLAPSVRGSQPACIDFEYDEVGNLEASTDRGRLRYPASKPSGLPMPHAPDRVTKPSGQTVALAYDDAGRIVAAGAQRFEWTDAGKLRRVTGALGYYGADETFYEYGADGAVARTNRAFGTTVYAGGLFERTESQSSASSRQTWSAGGTHAKYVVEVEGRVIAEIMEQEVGYTTVRRGERAGIWSDGGGPLSAAALDSMGLFVPGAWTIVYLHADRVGSTVLVTDDAGDVVERKNYDAFGWARSPEWRLGGATGSFGQQSVGYAEGVEDPGSGWVAMGARMYVPWLARFASPDPLISGIGTQARARYAYATNNPLRWKDTTGLDNEPADDEIQVTRTVLGEWPPAVIVGVRIRTPLRPMPSPPPRPAPPPPPPGPKVDRDAGPHFRAPGYSEGTQHAMAHNRMVFNANAREATESDAWKDKVVTAATVIGTAGAIIPVVGDAVSLVSSIVIYAVEPTDENLLGVAGDAAGLLIPGLPALGSVKRAAKLAAHAGDASHIAGGIRDAERVAEIAKDAERAAEAAQGAGRFSPSRELPVDKWGVPKPDVDAPHTQLGRSRDKFGGEPQAREWDYGSNGKLQPQRDIDFTDHGTPDVHTSPHQHRLSPNNPEIAPQGGYRRGGPTPL